MFYNGSISDIQKEFSLYFIDYLKEFYGIKANVELESFYDIENRTRLLKMFINEKYINRKLCFKFEEEFFPNDIMDQVRKAYDMWYSGKSYWNC